MSPFPPAGSFMISLWVGFIVLVLALLALDLGVFNRKDHVISFREAMGWTAFWIALSFVFNAGVYFLYEHHLFGIGREIGHELSGRQASMLFLTAYLIEKSLSLDNIFVMAVIFSYFSIPGKYQHRVLFWGIVGALVMRGAMIAAGIALIERFSWMIYVFGGLLIVTAFKMLTSGNEDLEPEKNPLLKLLRRYVPVTTKFAGHSFFTMENARRVATPLLPALVVVESTDVLFAVDSIPAVIAVTSDPFIVFTSNVFAILGLRSLYFALAAMMARFRYIKYSLVFVLAFVGVKMLVSHHVHVPTGVSLGVIAVSIAVGIGASLFVTKGSKSEDRPSEA